MGLCRLIHGDRFVVKKKWAKRNCFTRLTKTNISNDSNFCKQTNKPGMICYFPNHDDLMTGYWLPTWTSFLGK